MPTLIISDTTCLVLLDKIEKLEILHSLYGQITITSTIAKEFLKDLPQWIRIRDPEDKNNVNELSKIVDAGEATAIALSQEIKNCVLILDDLKARKLAEHLDLKFTGTIGVLILAQEKGFLNSPDDVIAKIKSTNFRISQSLIERLKSQR